MALLLMRLASRYRSSGLHFTNLRIRRNPMNLHLNTPRFQSFRTFGTTGSSTFFVAPKITFFRLILTGGATTFGYISYKINSKQTQLIL